MKRALVFTSAHCAPCKQMLAALKNIEIETIDINARPDLVKKYNVRSAPTVIVLDGDWIAASFVNYSEAIVRAIKQAMGGIYA